MSDRRRSHEVRGPGTDRRGHRHRAPAVRRLRECDGDMRHALLVVTAPRRQVVPCRLQRLAQTGHVPVAENGPYPGDERYAGLDQLGRDVAHQSLRRGQPDTVHGTPRTFSDWERFDEGKNIPSTAIRPARYVALASETPPGPPRSSTRGRRARRPRFSPAHGCPGLAALVRGRQLRNHVSGYGNPY